MENRLKKCHRSCYAYNEAIDNAVKLSVSMEQIDFDYLTKPEADNLVMLLKPIIDLREKLIRRANSLPYKYSETEEKVYS